MTTFAFLLKTYGGDFLHAQRLLKSYAKHNRERLPLYLVAPARDMEVFEGIKVDCVEVLAEEAICGCLVKDDSIHGVPAGYINQELIKLCFWETGLARNYFCIDSDAYFIRDFWQSDFMHDNSTPYTILQEDRDLHSSPAYYRQYWIGREKWIELIKTNLGYEDRRSMTCHGMATLSSEVLAAMKVKHMAPRGLDYVDLLRIAPLEFSWYSFWLQKDKTIPIEIREPMFKTFHLRSHHLEFRRQGVTLQDLARAYVGVVVNSNFSRAYGLIDYDTRIPYGILGATSHGIAIQSLWSRAARRARRAIGVR